MTIWMVFGLVLIGVSVSTLLRQTQPTLAVILAAGIGALLLGMIVSEVMPLVGRVTRLMGGVADEAQVAVLFKAVGIGIVTQFATDVCRDAGETSLANKAELAGRVLMLVCGLPLFEQAASLLESMIRGQAVMG